MSKCCTPVPTRRVSVSTCRWAASLILALAFWGLRPDPAQASPAEDDYLKIYRTIEAADALADAGKTAPAITNYQQADRALKEFRRTFPTYNPKLVGYRQKYVSDKITRLSQPPPEVETNAPVKFADPNQPQLTLTTPGAEPRALLRLQPQVGDKQSLLLTMKMKTRMTLPGQAQPQSIDVPAIKFTLDAEVKDVSAAGDIAYSVAYGEMEVENEAGAAPEMAQAIKSALGNLSGLTAVGTNTSRGFNKGFQMHIPSDANPQMQQMLAQMGDSLKMIVNPLPEEPVGVGAKWEFKLPIKSQGMTLTQTTSTELISRDDHQATFKISLTQTATNQKISNPAMPGLKVDLTKLSGTGTGETTIALNQLLPTQATLNSQTDLTVGMGGGNPPPTMKMTMEMQFNLHGK